MGGGVLYDCKNTSIFVRQRYFGTTGNSNGAKPRPYRRCWLLCTHEKRSRRGCLVWFPFLNLVFYQKLPPAVTQAITAPPSHAIYVSID